ncbi:hypothetical protein L2E82_45151 [Cichorium intybus]|uniref:Uncharacterized protein n=1 Tax=Cichorium intybus TaxID=13427 RepID=A0ACB8ZS81_CICIN|nr:hypothetical protein L2E82_45151 [Cichorium intybus]
MCTSRAPLLMKVFCYTDLARVVLLKAKDKMVVVHAKARNNRDLNAASIQLADTMIRQYQISRESDKDKNGAVIVIQPIRLLTELCSSYRLLNVPAAGCYKLVSEPRARSSKEWTSLSQAPLNEGQRGQIAENPHDKQW